jgi:hypothetical protein
MYFGVALIQSAVSVARGERARYNQLFPSLAQNFDLVRHLFPSPRDPILYVFDLMDENTSPFGRRGINCSGPHDSPYSDPRERVRSLDGRNMRNEPVCSKVRNMRFGGRAKRSRKKR